MHFILFWAAVSGVFGGLCVCRCARGSVCVAFVAPRFKRLTHALRRLDPFFDVGGIFSFHDDSVAPFGLALYFAILCIAFVCDISAGYFSVFGACLRCCCASWSSVAFVAAPFPEIDACFWRVVFLRLWFVLRFAWSCFCATTCCFLCDDLLLFFVQTRTQIMLAG